IHSPGDVSHPTTTRDSLEDRKILQVVSTRVRVAQIVWCDAEGIFRCAGKIDSEAGIGKDGVAQDSIAGARADQIDARTVGNARIFLAVEGNDITCASRGATDRIVAVLDEDATGAVAQVSGSIHSGTDVVALNQNIRALEKDAVVPIGGNDIARSRSRAADVV